jgi:putative transposase
MILVIGLWTCCRAVLLGSAAIALENLALRHQLLVLQRSVFWVWLSRVWASWRSSLVIVQSATVLAWHREGFRLYWRWKSRANPVGRPRLDPELRYLIRRMARENPTWGRRLFVVLRHDRRELLHVNVTDHPTATWTARQIVEAFPGDSAARFLLRDRDTIYGEAFGRRVQDMGMREVLTAPRAPWQNPFVERVIGSVRRECLDHYHFFVRNEAHLRWLLRRYLGYYNLSRPHQALGNNSPHPRNVQPPSRGRIVATPQVGGLHHRYQRVA